MKMVHKTVKIIIIVTLILGTIALVAFFFKKGHGNVLDKVSKQAVSVLVLNVPSLSAKLLLNEISTDVDKRISARIAKLAPDSLANIDWTANGLALFEKMVLFSLEDTTSADVNAYFIMRIANAKKFNLFVKNIGNKLHFSLNKYRDVNLAFSKSLGFLIAWNNNFVTGMKTFENNDKNTERLIHILATPQQQSIVTDTCFTRKLAGSYDVLLYSRPYVRCPIKPLEMFNSGLKNIAALITFSKGELNINADVQPIAGSILDKIFIETNKEMETLANADSALLNIDLHVNALAFKQFYSAFKTIDIKANTPLFTAWDGNLSFVFRGSKEIESEYVTYRYDDNFNKIEKKESKHDKVFDLHALAGMYTTTTDSIFKLYPPIIKGKDTLIVKGSNFVMTKMDHRFLVYNKYFLKPGIERKKANTNICIEANYPKLTSILKDMGYYSEKQWLQYFTCKTISLNANKKENIILTTKIFFENKDTNSFYSLFEMVEKVRSRKY